MEVAEVLNNLKHLGQPSINGMELDEDLNYKKPNFFSRIIRQLFGSQRKHDEKIVDNALRFLNEHLTDVEPKDAIPILAHLKPLIHDPLTEVKATVLLSLFEHIEVDHTVVHAASGVDSQIEIFRRSLLDFKTPNEVQNCYQQCLETYDKIQKKIPEYKLSIIESIQDEHFKRALLERQSFETFCQIDPETKIFVTHKAIEQASEQINQEVLKFYESLNYENSKQEIEDRYQKCQALYDKWSEKIPGHEDALTIHDNAFKRALMEGMPLTTLAQLDPEIGIHINTVDLTRETVDAETLANARDVKVYPHQIQQLLLAKTPVKNLVIRIDEQNNTLSKADFDALKSLIGSLDPKPRVLWKNSKTNQALKLNGGYVPAIKGIRDLTLSGDVNLMHVLGNFPDLVILDIKDSTTKLPEDTLTVLCPKLQEIHQ